MILIVLLFRKPAVNFSSKKQTHVPIEKASSTAAKLPVAVELHVLSSSELTGLYTPAASPKCVVLAVRGLASESFLEWKQKLLDWVRKHFGATHNVGRVKVRLFCNSFLSCNITGDFT